MTRRAAVLALAIGIAIPAEGLRQVAYIDPAGILTICYGDTHSVKPGQIASLDECRARLDKEMLGAIAQVEKCAPGLPDNVLAAFADATYNAGPKIACDSTASRYLRAGDYTAACRQLPRWDKVCKAGACVSLPGLTKRRNAEMALCLRGLT